MNTRRQKIDVQDDYHGHLVKDPFRWLEDTDSSDTQRWISDQNALTNQYLSDIPDRDSIRERLEILWNYERFGIPTKRGDSYFFSHNDGLQNQSILYRSTTLDSKRMVLLDPNQLSDDGTVALAGTQLPKTDGFLPTV